jgi:hypothetical protein
MKRPEIGPKTATEPEGLHPGAPLEGMTLNSTQTHLKLPRTGEFQ